MKAALSAKQIIKGGNYGTCSGREYYQDLQCRGYEGKQRLHDRGDCNKGIE
jgi:hypothetical protein